MVPLMFSSHLHCPLKLRFLECPPDLTGNEEYVDEAAMFFSNPLHWLRTSFPSQSTLPSHIVLFDSLEKVKDWKQWNQHIQHKCCRIYSLILALRNVIKYVSDFLDTNFVSFSFRKLQNSWRKTNLPNKLKFSTLTFLKVDWERTY